MPRKTWHSLPEYQTFRAMMESSTTAAAARRLGLSQSAVSRSLSSLEARIGNALFERDAGRLKPTSAATMLNARLDGLFEALEQIDGPPDSERENLRIIAPPTFANKFLTGHIGSFLKTRSDYFLSLEFGPSEDVILGVRAGRFDLGVIGVEPTRAGTKLIPFRRSVAVCAMLSDHPLAKLKEVSPGDLHLANLIAQSYRHARRSQLEKLLQEQSVKPNIVAEVTSSVAAAELVQAGLGVAIINPFPLALQDLGELVFRPFPSALSYQTYFVTPDDRPLSRVARHFMQHVRLHTPSDTFSSVV
ncbi:MAG: LysR family transcriptional regulator [Rhodobacteraceae bacterium]|nr:LysR family transcriptional regulator [Paracoccaceae bacterium]